MYRRTFLSNCKNLLGSCLVLNMNESKENTSSHIDKKELEQKLIEFIKKHDYFTKMYEDTITLNNKTSINKNTLDNVTKQTRLFFQTSIISLIQNNFPCIYEIHIDEIRTYWVTRYLRKSNICTDINFTVYFDNNSIPMKLSYSVRDYFQY